MFSLNMLDSSVFSLLLSTYFLLFITIYLDFRESTESKCLSFPLGLDSGLSIERKYLALIT